MIRRNRGGPTVGDDFPYEMLSLDAVPSRLVEATYAWKWWKATDPDRPKMRAFRFHDAELDANGEKHLAQCGKLLQLRYRVPDGSNMGYTAQKFSLPPDMARWSYLKFDEEDPGERLYTVLPEKVKRYVAAHLYDPCPFEDVSLKQLAKWTGGRQANGWYANVIVRPIGIATAVLYDGDKRNDGRSNYIHRFGEETGIRPAIGVDATGRIWFAGGDYTCPTAGITN